VSDFILSHFLCSNEEDAHHNKEIICYTSPEMLKGNTDYDEEALVWSCGIILYYMVNGKKPFYASKSEKLSSLILKEEPNLTTLTDDLQDLLLKMLCKFPKKRIKLIDILVKL
jgi:serine/threonine protein kinase